jgi:hypothetical protein
LLPPVVTLVLDYQRCSQCCHFADFTCLLAT